jgi:hypothetical protein
MTIEYRQQGEKRKVENVMQIISYGDEFLNLYDERGSFKGSVNILKCEEFSAVDFGIGKESPNKPKRKRSNRKRIY